MSGLHPSISGRVGTVTYVKIGCKFETVASQLEAEASICSIKIEQATRHITIHNVYYPECDGEGEWLKYHSDSHCLVVGDFNQHSVLWEDGYTGREPKLGAGITGSDFVLLNDGTLTRVPDRSHDRGTAVDLALVTPDLVGDVEWSVGDDPLSSDHLPITINITGTVMRELVPVPVPVPAFRPA